MSNKRKFEIFTENIIPEINKEDVKNFSQGFEERENLSKRKFPWENFDPRKKPIHGLNLRLNDYELSLLRFIAEKEDRSQQKIIKKLLIPLLENTAKKLM